MRLKTGDKVTVLVGEDQGKTGKILQVFPRLNKASVEGINLMVKHLRKRREGEKGQKVQFAAPVMMDRLMLVCPRCGKATRVKVKTNDSQKLARVCHHWREII